MYSLSLLPRIGFWTRPLALASIISASIVWVSASSVAVSAELVMFERSGCPWCARWDREVGSLYARTEEGRKAPLRKVNIDRGVPAEFRLTPPVFYSPTFVLIDGGREVGRITGYLGDDAFWGLYARMLKELLP